MYQKRARRCHRDDIFSFHLASYSSANTPATKAPSPETRRRHIISRRASPGHAILQCLQVPWAKTKAQLVYSIFVSCFHEAVANFYADDFIATRHLFLTYTTDE